MSGSSLIRHLPATPCSVCRGHANLPQGRSVRCAGFTLDHVTYCTREEFAGRLTLDIGTDPPAFRHRLVGGCGCGVAHGARPALTGTRPIQPTAEPVLAATIRADIYERALSLLPVRAEALQDLTNRGLTPGQVHEMGYRSIPRRGREHQAFLDTMIGEFGEATLRQCPGFTDKNRRLTFWTAFGGRDGYVVPYCDGMRRVTGLQLKVLGGRYLTATGTRLKDVYHVAGTPQGADLYLTESATKANVAHVLGGISVFAVAGQSLKQSHIDAIKRLAPEQVIVALDEEDNAHTDQARERWLRSLNEAGLPTCRATWEGADVGGPKGIDDLVRAGGRPRIRAVSFAPPAFGSRRVPYHSGQVGPVDGGMSLAHAREQTARSIDRFVGDTRNGGKAQLIASSAGTGKSTALARSIERHRRAARVLVGTRQFAAELAAEHGYVQIAGRDADNCERHEVAKALGEAGHDVERLACGSIEEPRCPVRLACRYWEQFAQPGPRVAATEQLFNPHFLAGGTLLALDDPELLRSLVGRPLVSGAVLARAVDQLTGRRREPLRRVLVLVQHVVTDAPERSLTGPTTWDHLAKTAARYSLDLVKLVEALPANPTLPEPEAAPDGYITTSTVDAVPPATILAVLKALREELTAFRSGADFNSRLRLGRGGIEVWTPRAPVPDRHGIPIAPQMALLVLDATPVPPLVEHVMRDHERLPDVRAAVRLPENVTVVQYASSSNGHAVLAHERNVAAVVGEVMRERADHPVADPEQEAVIGFKRNRAPFVEAGFAPSQVLGFGSLRGTNALEDVRRLHVVGRPMPPSDDLVYLAEVLHHDAPRVSSAMTLVERTYGGQRSSVDVVDFVDSRVSELLRATRDDELVQVIHRARLFTVQPQLELGREGQREHVRVVLHTNHVVPGLRVDELHLAGAAFELNQRRREEAERRIGEAISTVIARGDELTVSAVARVAGAQRRTVAKALGKGVQTLKGTQGVSASATSQTEEVGTPVQAVRSDLSKGVHTFPQAELPLPTPSSAGVGTARGADREPCRGGCGKSMPPGQKCVECATAAVEAWLVSCGRRPSQAVVR